MVVSKMIVSLSGSFKFGSYHKEKTRRSEPIPGKQGGFGGLNSREKFMEIKNTDFGKIVLGSRKRQDYFTFLCMHSSKYTST